jgi:hypothetical protein
MISEGSFETYFEKSSEIILTEHTKIIYTDEDLK